ncbi:hypothetical protein [Adhaeribacter rhizoryzae]|uniref:J domain-containing protein n=1 Tax=Adhaeribacter rhizoryzae TaxID=2607907 RepID=A0A5M6DHD4_9BACT|nr:hypothetical protein [Adhaeribacter rhizoryzae]KAA5545680.1 hypothetical protein F0145_12145 [Adhaeribacter rhizoryzae]
MAKSPKKIFPKEPISKKELAITKPKQQVLSKPQQTFNRLTKKIEKLQQEIANTSRILDEKLAFYGENIHPLEKQLVALRRQTLQLLLPYYTNKKLLPKKDKKILRDVLAEQLNDVLSFSDEEPDEELKKAFEAVEGVKYEEAQQQDFDQMKSEMTEIFEEFGFQMNFDELCPDMSPEEMMEQMQTMEEKLLQQAQDLDQEVPDRKKSKKLLEREEREKQAAEVKSKSISRIYKQLAKVLHPDLEQEAELKAYKELRMRELTTAYEKNDLHTLLRLELEWIEKEEANLEKLTDDKLKIYNEVLKEQIADLEEESFSLMQHPRYQPLLRLAMFPGEVKIMNLARKKNELNEMLEDLESSIARLKGENAFDEVIGIINLFKLLY